MAKRLVDKEIAKFDSVDAVRVNIESTDTANGYLPVESQNNGHVCEDNSTVTPILAAAVFTGVWQDTLNYNTVTVGIISDQDSATDGLSVDWSADGTTKTQDDVFSILANSGKVFTFSPANRYMRIVYTNGAVDQTLFNIQTIFKKGGFKPSSHRITDSIVGDDDAELVKAVLTGISDSGTFLNVNTTDDGVLKVSNESSGLSIAEGNVTGKTFIHKFGNAPDFATGDGVVSIWDGADSGDINQMIYIYSTTAAIDSISSSDAGDTQELKIQGLTLDGTLTNQVKTLQGQTRVALDTPLYRVFRMKNNNNVDNAGHVYCYENTTISAGVPVDSTKVRSVIQPGNNQTLMAIYTIPAGTTGYMRDWYGAVAGASKSSNYIIQLRAREPGGVFQLKHLSSLSDSGTSSDQHTYAEPEVFAEMVDLEMRVSLTAVGASGASFSAGFDIVLKSN